MSAKLFNLLCKEKDHIRDVIFPAIDELENESYQNNNIEGMKQAIRLRIQVNKRLSWIVRQMEKIVESWEAEERTESQCI